MAFLLELVLFNQPDYPYYTLWDLLYLKNPDYKADFSSYISISLMLWTIERGWYG
jgi:hypothetical protein